MLLKKLLTAAAVAGLLFSFSASMTGCCGGSDKSSAQLEKELDEEFGRSSKKTPKKKAPKKMVKKTPKKAPKKAPPKKFAKKPGEATQTAGKAGAPAAAMSRTSLASITPKSLQAKVPKTGWKISKKPNQTGPKSVTLSVSRGSSNGAISLNTFPTKSVADTFYKTMAQNNGAALRRDGNKLLSVVIPGKKAEAEKLMKKLLEK